MGVSGILRRLYEAENILDDEDGFGNLVQLFQHPLKIIINFAAVPAGKQRIGIQPEKLFSDDVKRRIGQIFRRLQAALQR